MERVNLENVHLNFQTLESETKVLNSINLTVEDGEFISIVGPSGCGKSTILNLISSLIKPNNGTVTVAGKIGYMLQKDHLFSWRNVLNNCLLGPEIQKLPLDTSKVNVINLMKRYGLEDFIYHYPNQLSGGMRQRVALIRTLATEPEILLLDEAFSALDALTRVSVGNDIWEILKKEKKTVIFVTHDINEAISLSDRIVILSKRPASIKEIIDIDIKDISPLKRRTSSQFSNYFDLLWKEMHENE